MFSNPSVLPSFWLDLAASVLVLAVSALAGRLLCTRQLHGDDPLERLAGMLVTGLLFTVGMGVTWVFRRPGVHTLVPVVLVAAALWSRRRPLPAPVVVSSALPAWLALGAVTLVTALFHAWQFDWLGADGLIHHGHGDLGYFGMLAKALPEARMSDGWSAVGGSALVDAGMAQDQWYHWGPVWLGMLIQQVTGLPAIESMLNVGATVMCTVFILVSAAVVRALTRWNVIWSTLVGIASIMTLAVPPLARPLLAKLLPFGWLQHGWDSLLFQFSYQFEALQVVLVLLCWLRGRNALALVLVFCATVGSPHFVGGVGVAVGTLMVLGVLKRDKALWMPAASAVGTILLAWGTLHWLLGVQMLTGLGSSGGGGLFGFTWQTLVASVCRILGDMGIGLLIGLLVVPGWLALIRVRRNNDDSLPPQARVLGWLAFAALAGSMAAFHLFTHAEKFHFVIFPMAVLAQPIAVFGLAVWASQLSGWRRALPLLPLFITLAACMVDAQQRKDGRVNSGRTVEQMNALKQQLHGQPFGYISKADRPWWIPKRAFMAALLDSRCVRLNPLQDADVGNSYSRFYNSYRLMELTPYKEGTPIHEWSLKLAKSLGIRHILQTKSDPVPPAIVAACKAVFQTGDVILYEIQQPPAVASVTP